MGCFCWVATCSIPYFGYVNILTTLITPLKEARDQILHPITLEVSLSGISYIRCQVNVNNGMPQDLAI